MKKYILAALYLVAFPGISSAEGYVTNAMVISFGTFQGIGDYLFIQVDQSIIGTPCSTNPYQFALSLSTPVGQQTMAMLLAARASGLPVSITGSGTCYDNSETVVNVTY